MDAQTLLQLLKDGGLTVYPLGLASVITLTILLERLWRYHGLDGQTREITRQTIEFLIDSGAVYSVVPTPILQRLGISPLTEQEFRLADGSKIVRKKGVALFVYGDRIGGADVIFGEEGDSVLLGAFTLEALGLSLDPLRRVLNPLPMILAFQTPNTGSDHKS